MQLAYARSGNPDAPAIVFLHGMAMGAWMWDDQVRHFADYDCYTVDLPGHDGSNRIAWVSFEQAADCVAQVIAQAVPDKPVYVVGMSLGAAVGLHLLTRSPRGIERAVLSGPLGETPPRWLTTVQGQLMVRLLPSKIGQQLFARMLQLPAEALPHYRHSIDALSMPAVKQMLRQISVFTPPDGLSDISVPSLFVTGEKDIAVNRRSVVVLARQVPGAVGVYAPGGHHGWNGEDPALFNAMTRAWIEGQPLPRSLIPAEG